MVSYYRNPGIIDNSFDRTDTILGINCAGESEYADSIFANATRRDYYLFVLVEGDVEVHPYNKSISVMHGGDIIVYSKNNPFAYTNLTSMKYRWVHFSGTEAQRLLESYSIETDTVYSLYSLPKDGLAAYLQNVSFEG